MPEELLIGVFLTILIFITTCFYTYRTTALNNMYASEVNCYTYIKLADKFEGEERKRYRDIARKWFKVSELFRKDHQRNCGYTIVLLDTSLILLVEFIIATLIAHLIPFIVLLVLLFLPLIFFLFSWYLIIPYPPRIEYLRYPLKIIPHGASYFLTCSLSYLWLDSLLKSPDYQWLLDS